MRRGDWVRVQRGIYAAAGSVPTPRRRLLGAQLAVAGQVRVTGAAACWLHGLLPEAPDVVDLIVPTERDLRAPVGARLRSTTRWRLTGDCGFGSLRSVGAAWALMDLCREADDRTASQTCATAVRLRKVTLHGLERSATDRGRFPGCVRLRRVLRGLRGELNHSSHERRLRGACRDLGLEPSARPQPVLIEGRIVAEADLLFRRAQIVVEVDGPHHLLPDQLRRDRIRDRRLAAAGWLVLRFTIWEIEDDAAAVAREVAEAVRSRTR